MTGRRMVGGYTPPPSGRPARPPRCCAKCRTPYMCGNDNCTCHTRPVPRPTVWDEAAALRKAITGGNR